MTVHLVHVFAKASVVSPGGVHTKPLIGSAVHVGINRGAIMEWALSAGVIREIIDVRRKELENCIAQLPDSRWLDVRDRIAQIISSRDRKQRSGARRLIQEVGVIVLVADVEGVLAQQLSWGWLNELSY